MGRSAPSPKPIQRFGRKAIIAKPVSSTEAMKPGYSSQLMAAVSRPAAKARRQVARPECHASEMSMNAPKAAAALVVWLTKSSP